MHETSTILKSIQNKKDLRGFTLLEAALMVAILSVVLGGTFSVLFYSERLFADQMKQYALTQSGARIMERLTEELRSAYPPTLLPLAISDSDYVTFQRVTGQVSGVVLLGSQTTISLEYRPSDLPNGRDDDGNGVIDDGYIVYTELGSAPVELAGNIMNVHFNSTSNGLSFTADVAIPDRGGVVRQSSFTREISFRIR